MAQKPKKVWIHEYFTKDTTKQMNTLHDIALGENEMYDLKRKNLKREINLLVQESEEFFDGLRETIEYKQEFNKALKLYQLSNKQELNGALNMQMENLIMFKSSRAEIFEKYSFLKGMFTSKKAHLIVPLKEQKSAYKLAIYLQVRDIIVGGMGFESFAQERLVAKKLAENDIDTTRLEDYKAFRLPSGSKVVAVKDKTKKPLADRETLRKQIPVAVRKSVSVATKRFREETVKDGTSFIVNNKKAIAFQKTYTKLINDDLDARPIRYNRECENGTHVVNTYFAENGHNSGKYSDLRRLLVDAEVFKVIENEKEL